MSGGGVHESVDGDRAWTGLLKGLEVVEGFDRNEPTYHYPHCVRLCPSNPDRSYQQNHCGIYRLDRPSDQAAHYTERHKRAAHVAAARQNPSGLAPIAWARCAPGVDVHPELTHFGE
jgi:hypothetical protein